MGVKILHVITALNVGGAETMLAKLIEQERSLDGADRQHVLSLMPAGNMAARIAATGTPLGSLGMRRPMAWPLAVPRLARLARGIAPDLIMGWMYHGQLAATLAAALIGRRTPVIWNVRHSLADIGEERLATRLILRIGAMLSATPGAIVYNSHASAVQYRRIGFSAAREIVIPNGFDCEAFRPDPGARTRLVGELGIDGRSTIVAMVARTHPMKDPVTLVEAVMRARRAGADIHLLLAGMGMDRPLPKLAKALAHLPQNRITLLGHRDDVRPLIGGVDLVALPSAWGEGFPNILGEAMACGVPCIATDVGDSGWIIGETGRTVPPRDPEAMAAALVELARMDAEARARLGVAARARIVGHFSIAQIADDYARLYREVANGGHARRSRRPLKHEAKAT